MKQRMVSGIKPSGELHIGNYLGAIRQWADLQEEFDLFLFVADLHAITVPQDPAELRRRTMEIIRIYLAAGIDPQKTTLFVQSHIPEHAQLGWILNTIAKNGDLTKMTQFKDKAKFDFDTLAGSEGDDYFSKFDTFKEFTEENQQLSREELVRETAKKYVQLNISLLKERFNDIGVGLFDYPVLMAGDIILYDAEKVPVGDDQIQHVELTRTLARRFNKRFGETFTVPQPLVRHEQYAQPQQMGPQGGQADPFPPMPPGGWNSAPMAPTVPQSAAPAPKGSNGALLVLLAVMFVGVAVAALLYVLTVARR